MSSQLHCSWSLAVGGTLEDRPRYQHQQTFNAFPFPALEESPLKQRIRDLGERLDSHRKRQQEQHPGLTLTGIYNVLEKLRSGEPLNAKEKLIHDQGLVTVLRQIHDELDAAVLEAYDWQDLRDAIDHLRDSSLYDWTTGVVSILDVEDPKSLPEILAAQQAKIEQELLTRLVALNHERAAEEKRGLIRWLRPEYQNPTSAAPHPVQTTLDGTDLPSSKSKIQNQQSSIDNPSPSLPWPDRLPEQVAILRKLIGGSDKSVETPDAEALSGLFGRKNKKRTEQIEGILETLKGLGQL